MRIALVGKGGSGKTTVASLLLRYLMLKGKPVLAIDADINQHLAEASGIEVSNLAELGNNLLQLKRILRGNNQLIPSADTMVKTTLPSSGSHFIQLTKDDLILKAFAQKNGNSWFIRIGGFNDTDLGQRCFHAKTGGAELILNHLVDKPDETVILDMTAGADAFASGLFSRFDLTVIVVEPTIKSIHVYEQYKKYVEGYNIAICAVGNKVADVDDLAFLKKKCGADLIGYFSCSKWVKQTERGETLNIQSLEPSNLAVLESILSTARQYPRDWHDYWKWGIHFHHLNAKGWANNDMGCNVSKHIDEEFLKSFQPEKIWNSAD